MLGIGWTEFVVIALVMLVFVGPKNLPPLFRKVGSVMAEFKSAGRELRNQIDIEVGDLQSPGRMVRKLGREAFEAGMSPYEEIRKAEREIKTDLASAMTPAPPDNESYAAGYSNDPVDDEISESDNNSKDEDPEVKTAKAGPDRGEASE